MRQRRADGRATRVGRGGVTLLVGATTVVVVVSAILAVTIRREPPSLNRRLAEAVGAHRVVQARLTGGYQYAPCRNAREPNDSLVIGVLCVEPTPSQWPEGRALSKLAVELKPSAGGPSGAHRHAVGAWNIIWRNADAALAELRAGAALDASNARVQSDLAAAFLLHAELRQDPLSVLDAYTANDSALKLDPRLVEALFNRAVILERLHLTELAASHWRAYIAVDGESPWGDEARTRLRALTKRAPSWSDARRSLDAALAVGDSGAVLEVVRRFPWRAREVARVAHVDWARAYTADPSTADTIARRAALLARALRATTTDPMWYDIAAGIDSARMMGDRSRLDEIARGFLEHARARASFDRLSLDSAKLWLDRATASFGRGRSAAVHLAAYDLGRVSYQRHSRVGYGDAVARFHRVLSSTPAAYRWVRGLATRNIGFIELVGARFDVALASFSAAIQEGGVVRDPALELRTRTDAARALAMLRGEAAGWYALHAAFRAIPQYPDTPAEMQRLFATAAVLSWRRAPAVAPLFQREAVQLTASLGDSVLMVTALTREAELLARIGRPVEAMERLRGVSAYARGIESDSIRALMLADAELVHGQVWLRDRPDSAVRLLRDVVARYDDTRYLVQVGRANLLLASAYVAVGAVDSARVTFDHALAAMEHARTGITSFDDRTRFLDEARPVIDTVVRFHVSQRDTLAALEFIERMRARVLLERGAAMPNATSADRSIAVLRGALGNETSIISYVVLEGELIGWLLRRDGVWMRRIPTDNDLQQLIHQFTRLIAARSDGPDIAAVSARLHELLVAPFEPQIPRGSRLVVVPDKWLHFVPFAALFDPKRREFLVEAYELAVAPSVQLFAEASERYARRDETGPVSMLAVGNPSFDRLAYQQLPLLPGAEREARDAAGRYASSRLLIGPEATRSEFLTQARSASIIHFAGHGVVSPDAPLLSHLVLAPDSGGASSGAVYARDLFAMSLSATRLAILSGCQTAAGELSSTEGVSSLARALFAAGVPAVIASLWAVEDRGTDAFFSSYHKDLSRNGDPGGALRRTQVEWIRRGDPWRTASTWAAFQLFGAAGRRGPARDVQGKRSLQPSISVGKTAMSASIGAL